MAARNNELNSGANGARQNEVPAARPFSKKFEKSAIAITRQQQEQEGYQETADTVREARQKNIQRPPMGGDVFGGQKKQLQRDKKNLKKKLKGATEKTVNGKKVTVPVPPKPSTKEKPEPQRPEPEPTLGLPYGESRKPKPEPKPLEPTKKPERGISTVKYPDRKEGSTEIPEDGRTDYNTGRAVGRGGRPLAAGGRRIRKQK